MLIYVICQVMRLSNVKPMAKKQRKKLEKVLSTKTKKAHVSILNLSLLCLDKISLLYMTFSHCKINKLI